MSRNSKKRTDRKNKMDDTMKSILTKSIQEKKKKNFHRIKLRETELGRIKYADKLDKLQNALNKIRVVNKNLNEIREEWDYY